MSKKLETSIGLFVVTGMIALAAMIVKFGSGDYLAYRDAVKFAVHFNFADGLLVQAPVRYAGVDVGRVDEIRLSADPQQKVLLDLLIKKGVDIRKEDYITINSLGLMSEMYVEIIPGPPSARLVKGGDILKGEDPVALQQVVTKAKKVLESLEKGVDIFSDEETKEDIRNSLRNAKVLSEEMKNIAFSLKDSVKIMADVFVTNKDNIKDSISEFTLNIKGMRRSVDSVERILARVEKGEGLVGRLISDEKLAADFSESLEKMKVVFDDLHEINLNIKKGEGTIGMLIYDKETGEKLKKFIFDVEKNPWKIFRKK
jgi:phospholipid/cholesterol/gamma-HCH transport system substrate-binding protein